MALLLSLLHLLQAASAAYTLYQTSISIRNLQSYEETAKKAAKYSNTAASQLQSTRTTQAAAALSVLLSFFSSSAFIFYFSGSGATTTLTKLLLSVVNVLVLEASRRHIQDFWSGKMRVPLPGTGEYNEAMGKTQGVILDGMLYLEGGWAISGILGLAL